MCHLKRDLMINLLCNRKLLILPLLMAVLILWSSSCAPSVRYTRPSAKKSTGSSRPSAKKKVQAKKETNNTSIDKVDNSTNSTSNDDKLKEAQSSGDNSCGLRKVIDSYVGIPYKYGGVDRRGLDCSGLVYRVFKDLGHQNLKRTSSSVMFKMGSAVSKRKMVPGDLVFFKRKGKINHVGIYMGGREFAHSSSTIGVSYTTLDNQYFRDKFVGARRIYKCQ